MAKKKSKNKPMSNGRNRRGQFTNKNKAAVGRKDKPADDKAHKLKNALIQSVTEKDIKTIAKKLIAKAKKGEVIAIKELFDRLWGRAKQEVDFGDKSFNTLADIAARMAGAI